MTRGQDLAAIPNFLRGRLSTTYNLTNGSRVVFLSGSNKKVRRSHVVHRRIIRGVIT